MQIVEIWDTEAKTYIQHKAVDAREILASDPDRYLREQPEAKAEKATEKPADKSKAKADK